MCGVKCGEAALGGECVCARDGEAGSEAVEDSQLGGVVAKEGGRLDDLGLSTRVRNALTAIGCSTTEDVERRRHAIMSNRVPDLGVRGMAQVARAMGWDGDEGAA